MLKLVIILTLLLYFSAHVRGQEVNHKDSLDVMSKVEEVFRLFENPDFGNFQTISTKRIYCIICFDFPHISDDPYMLERQQFYDQHLKYIQMSGILTRARNSQKILVISENDHRTDITVFFTIYQNDEIAPGHEGGQLGMYFRKVNGTFKFAGLETIP